MNWDREFDDPVPGCRSLRDAANLIVSLPKAEQDKPHWRAAIEALILVAEMDGDMLLARVGMLKALNFGKPEPDKQPRRKTVKTYRIIR
jgi:hypothetical protein